MQGDAGADTTTSELEGGGEGGNGRPINRRGGGTNESLFSPLGDW